MIAMLLAKFFNLFHNESTHILKWYFINPLHAERFFLTKQSLDMVPHFLLLFSHTKPNESQSWYSVSTLVSPAIYNSKFNSVSHKIAEKTEHQLRLFIDFERSSTFCFFRC